MSLLFFELLVDLRCSRLFPPFRANFSAAPLAIVLPWPKSATEKAKCRKLGQHPLAEGKVLIRDRQAKPQCVGRGITNEQHPAFPWPQEGHLACTVARCVLGTTEFEVIQFVFHFYGFETYNMLVNLNNRLVNFFHVLRHFLRFPYRIFAGLIVSWLGVCLCIYIGRDVYHHLCIESLGCEGILTSVYSKLFGVPLSAYGFWFYVTSFVLFGYCGLVTGDRLRRVLKFLCFLLQLGTVVSIGLLLLQVAVLHGLCSLCTASFLTCLVLMLIAFSLCRRTDDRVFTQIYFAVALIPAVTYIGLSLMAQPGEDPILFFVDGRSFRRSSLEPEFSAALRRIDRTQAQATTNLIRRAAADIVLKNEARSAGLTEQQYLSWIAADQAQTQQRQQQLTLVPHDRGIYENQKASAIAVYKLLAKHEFKISRDILHMNVINFDERFAIFDGSPHARVTLIVFFDFECPFCVDLAPRIRKLQSRFKDCLRVGVWEYPLPSHPHARLAAIAALAAAEQGKFWVYHDRLFEAGDLSEENLMRTAGDLGLDLKAFEASLHSRELSARLDAACELANQYGINGTPEVFLNGTQIDDPLPEEVEHAVETACTSSQ